MYKTSNIAMIPARIGSQRLKWKNLALINNKPLIYYAINSAKKSKKFDKIFINSDSKIFEEIASRYKVNFYLRPKKLGSSNTKSDDVVFDFLQNNKCLNLFWINPIAPLQSKDDIVKSVNFFFKSKCSSFFSVIDNKVHFIFKKKPVNFKINNKFQKTQDLTPVSEINYNIMAWNSKKFILDYKKFGYAFFCGKTSTFKTSKISNLIVKNNDDLNIIKNFIGDKTKFIRYDKVTKML
tara:strand:- start:181 stop:891 length:711 start_codon:yes stop_codon:yes gene_type:complete